jgi:hypothetical protein
VGLIGTSCILGRLYVVCGFIWVYNNGFLCVYGFIWVYNNGFICVFGFKTIYDNQYRHMT